MKVKVEVPDKVLYESIEVPLNSGSRIGLLGRSGAGKSLLFKSLIKELIASSDNRKIGFCPQYGGCFPWLSVSSNLKFGSKSIQEGKLKKILGRIGLSVDDINRYPNEISAGQRTRCGFAKAILSNPELYFLDEPFSGTDFEQTKLSCLYLKEEIDKTNCLFLSSHSFDDIIFLCDKALILQPQGKFEIMETPKISEFGARDDNVMKWIKEVLSLMSN